LSGQHGLQLGDIPAGKKEGQTLRIKSYKNRKKKSWQTWQVSSISLAFSTTLEDSSTAQRLSFNLGKNTWWHTGQGRPWGTSLDSSGLCLDCKTLQRAVPRMKQSWKLEGASNNFQLYTVHS